ncbi:MAG TPA: Na+/H+ antiporter subunit E [Burkholderiaceae bacterium]|nr:Na+/H+ antiporter subunit E [Burkholderiaceae bacterium]
MRRWLPAPMLSAALFVAWLLLYGTPSPGAAVFGAALAVLIPWSTASLRSGPLRLHAPGVALKLALVVLLDIVVSAVVVARQILGPVARLESRFIWVPLDLRDAHGIVTLASIITLTPGTIAADISPDQRHLLVHALHVDDPRALCDSIKRRYEQPLRVIFGEAGA